LATETLWTHGNAVVVEDPGEYSSIRHRGWGTELNYNPPGEDDLSYRVCHIPLSTPATIDGVAPTLVKIFILFETTPNLNIVRIDLWDGNNAIAQFSDHTGEEPPPGPGVFLGNGPHLTLDPNNQLPLPEPHRVSTGIGISFLCGMVPPQPLQLNVAAVGGEFVVPNPDVSRAPRPKAPSNAPPGPRTPKKGGH
jgi:hypothetical protein